MPMLTVLLAVGVCAIVSGPVTAQAGPFPLVPRPRVFMAVPLRDLTFGEVLPGIPEAVSVDHPRQAGMFEIQGIPDGTVRLEFLLPEALVSTEGAAMPIAFGPSDGYADFSRGRPPRGSKFDPHLPLVAALGPNGRLIVRLGGTVSPTRGQPRGEYQATIALTVFDLGI